MPHTFFGSVRHFLCLGIHEIFKTPWQHITEINTNAETMPKKRNPPVSIRPYGYDSQHSLWIRRLGFLWSYALLSKFAILPPWAWRRETYKALNAYSIVSGIYETTLGDEHPMTIDTYMAIGDIYSEKAREMYRKAGGWTRKRGLLMTQAALSNMQLFVQHQLTAFFLEVLQ